MTDYFVGVDLGGTNVVLGLVDTEGNVVGRTSRPTDVKAGPNALVERIGDSFRELTAQIDVNNEQVKAVGIGSPGPLSVKQGKIINAGNLPGFENFALRAEVSGLLGVPGILDNDANSACWGEFWRGAGRGSTDMVMFTLGTGIGGGIVSAGELLRGSEDNAAELGHMIIEPSGRLCSCGQRGCLEACASANHTAARAQQALKDRSGESSLLREFLQDNGELTCRDVFDCAEKGDSLANEIVDGTARALAQACVNVRHIVEPQIVVLAGGMINAGDILIERISRFYEEIMWTLKPEPMAIELALLGEDAGVIGAAGLALHDFREGRLCPVGT